MRKFLIGFNIVIVVTAVVLAGFWISRKADNGNQSALIDNTLVSRFDKPTETYQTPKELFQITREESSFSSVSPSGKELWYYNPENGEIRNTPMNGMPGGSNLMAKIQANAKNISWANNKSLVAQYDSGAIFYNLTTGSSKKYDPQVKNPVISRSGDKIAYDYYDKETSSGYIAIADPDIKGSKNLMPTRFGNWRLKWLTDSKLSLNNPESEQGSSSVFILGIDDKKFENIIDSKTNLKAIWSPDSRKILYSYKNPDSGKETLSVIEVAIKTERSLDLEIPASRCAWGADSKTVICAHLNKFISINTSAEIIEPATVAAISQIFGGGSATVSDLLMTSAGDRLIFKNLQNGRLYGVYLND